MNTNNKFKEYTNVTFVIVNFNTTLFLLKCIKSIKETCKNINYDIVVVDNNTPDIKNEQLLNKFPDVKYIFLPFNNGFGYGCNRGVEAANTKYVMFLNPDIIVTESAIENMIRFAESNDEIGFLSGLLMDDSNKLSYCFNDFPDICWETMEAFGIGAESKVNKLLSSENIKKYIPFEIDWAHGACLLVRRDLFEKLKGFDENIFLYYEDVDIQYRLKQEGYKNYCIPESKFIHYERSSVRDKKGEKIYYFYMHKSKLYYHKKNSSIFTYYYINMIYILAYIVRISFLPFRSKFKNCKIEKFKDYLLILGVYIRIVKNSK